MAAIKRLFSGFRSSRARKSDSDSHSSIQWVVAGLGNPGEEYSRSRHNSGFMTIDRIAKAKGVELSRRRFKGVTAEITLAEKPALLVKPQTFYNLSGECVSDLLGYFKITSDRLIVVHDELDLEAGRIRIKQGGGDAGNRGVRSIAATLGTPEFVRVRVGIGRPAPGLEAKDHVLHAMGRAELEAFKASIARAADAVEAAITSGLERAMNLYNQRT